MAMYATFNADGTISASSDWQFPGSTRVDYNIVRGYDGQLYKEGEAPDRPLSEYKKAVLGYIDNHTSQAILDGFDYTVDGDNLHFSYDQYDQINFADTANVATLQISGNTDLPQSVTWNAYKNWTKETGGELVRIDFTAADFLKLYTEGALGHKAACMEQGGANKARVNSVETLADLNTVINDIFNKSSVDELLSHNHPELPFNNPFPPEVVLPPSDVEE